MKWWGWQGGDGENGGVGEVKLCENDEEMRLKVKEKEKVNVLKGGEHFSLFATFTNVK